MSRIYFIDSENVADNWVFLLESAAPDDELLIFYTLKSPHMNYRNIRLLKESEKEVCFIECNAGNNGLDFQLSTELGYRMNNIGSNDFIIVSNDTGFDAIVKYWKKRHMSVTRITGKQCAFMDKPDSQTQETNDNTTQPDEEVLSQTDILSTEAAEEVKETPEQTANINDIPVSDVPETTEIEDTNAEIIDENAKEILYCIGKENLSELHEALIQIYGSEKCKSIYNSFKSDSVYDDYLESHEQMGRDEKRNLYCRVVFSVVSPETAIPEDFAEFVMTSWTKKNNLNSLRAALQKKYGKDNGHNYYLNVKAHMKILEKIK